jgi:hypothetical protein
MTLPTLTTLRNWAHSAAAVVGWLSLAFGIVQTAAASITATNPKYGQWLAAIGAGIVLLSKLIDSANAALLGITPSGTTAPIVPAPVVPPAVGV